MIPHMWKLKKKQTSVYKTVEWWLPGAEGGEVGWRMWKMLLQDTCLQLADK